MRFDTIISGGNIVDRTGKSEPFVADIGIQGDCIAAIGDLEQAEMPQEISAEGQVVSPGFVAVHVHTRGVTGVSISWQVHARTPIDLFARSYL